jgi:hypothetical protein
LTGKPDPTVDIDYVTALLADDWGFCHTALASLAKQLRDVRRDGCCAQQQQRRELTTRPQQVLVACVAEILK